MPRRARISVAGLAHHIIQRGNNRSVCFYDDQDYRFYLKWLKEYSELCQCQIHAYALMTNHVHLLVTPQTTDGVGLLMRRLGQRFVQYINRTYQRSGTLWEGRFKSSIAGEAAYVLGCYRHIESNPVRANIISHPVEYHWSSYRTNAQGETNDFVVPHKFYLQLGEDRSLRQMNYRKLFRCHLEPGLVDEILQATHGNYALGTARFRCQLEAGLGRRVSRGRSGRPKKER